MPASAHLGAGGNLISVPAHASAESSAFCSLRQLVVDDRGNRDRAAKPAGAFIQIDQERGPAARPVVNKQLRLVF
jgi:hypothetical protein